jgi:hypothetical protein
VTNDINAALDVFVRDLQTRTTTNGNALASFSLTADGRYVAAARFPYSARARQSHRARGR